MKTNATIIARLVELLEDPAEEWEFDEYKAMNRKRDIGVWTALLPVINTNTYPFNMPMGLISKWKLWRAVRRARENQVLRKLR